MADIWGKATQPLGSSIVNEYGTFKDKEEMAKKVYTGTGGGYKDGAGVFHSTEYEAKKADQAAAANGGHYYCS